MGTRINQLPGVCESINGLEIDIYRFQFSPQGAGTVTNVTTGRTCGIASIVYGGSTGLYTVQLVDGAPGNFLGGYCAVRSTAAGNMRGFSAEFDGTNGVETAGTISVAVYNTSNVLNSPTAAAGEYVYGWALFSRNPLTTN